MSICHKYVDLSGFNSLLNEVFNFHYFREFRTIVLLYFRPTLLKRRKWIEKRPDEIRFINVDFYFLMWPSWIQLAKCTYGIPQIMYEIRIDLYLTYLEKNIDLCGVNPNCNNKPFALWDADFDQVGWLQHSSTIACKLTHFQLYSLIHYTVLTLIWMSSSTANFIHIRPVLLKRGKWIEKKGQPKSDS